MNIFQPVNSDQIDLSQHERFIMVTRVQTPPPLGYNSALSDHRRFEVQNVETYIATDGREVHLALCGLHGSDPLPYDALEFRQIYPNLSFYAVLAPDEVILQSGWRMRGDHPVGRLHQAVATAHPTLLDETPLPWVVDTVKTYRPKDEIGGGLYSAIHICDAVLVGLPELAAV